MQNEVQLNHAKMVSPSAGFTARVMARIEQRERAQARRHALIGVGLIAVAVFTLFASIAFWVAGWLIALAANPDAIVTTALAVTPLAGDWLDALRVAGIALLQNMNGAALVVYALAVLILTILWAEIATGTFQPSLQVNWGGKRK